MKLPAWLRAFPRRPAAPAQQPTTPVRHDYSSGPLVPIPRLTQAQREARAQAREPAILAAVADAQAKAQAQGILAELHPAAYRLLIEQKYARMDLAEAQGLGWVVDELYLQAELQQQAAAMSLRLWQQTLVQRYGSKLGGKLGQHELEVGMHWEHVVACYGPPPVGAARRLAGHPNHWLVQYGRPATGSYFEVVDDVVTVARLGLPPLAAHLVAALELHH